MEKQTQVKEQNIGTGMFDFIPANQVILFLETYTYEWLPDNQLKVKCYNDENRIYKEIMKYFSIYHIQVKQTAGLSNQ